MMQMIYVATAGAVGALSRWGISRLAVYVLGHGFPYGTLIVNIVGCFLMGLIMQSSLNTARISETTRLTLTVGFLGALTTFSSFSYETLALMQQARWTGVFANIALNVVLSLLATLAGLAVSKCVFGVAA